MPPRRNEPISIRGWVKKAKMFGLAFEKAGMVDKMMQDLSIIGIHTEAYPGRADQEIVEDSYALYAWVSINHIQF